MIYEEFTHRIIGCAMKVHNKLGFGFQEVIYQRALAIELDRANIKFEREKSIDIYYDEIMIGARRVDFLIDENILVELKAVAELDKNHLAQAKNYLEVFNLPCGLLINFGNRSLEFKRLFQGKAINI